MSVWKRHIRRLEARTSSRAEPSPRICVAALWRLSHHTRESQRSRESRCDDLGPWRCELLVDLTEWPGGSARADARDIRTHRLPQPAKNNCVPSLI